MLRRKGALQAAAPRQSAPNYYYLHLQRYAKHGVEQRTVSDMVHWYSDTIRALLQIIGVTSFKALYKPEILGMRREIGNGGLE